jgi:myo-inositol-1(or 4)-monophosphatase
MNGSSQEFWEADLALARSLAERAGALIRSRWGTELQINHKGDVNLVSEVDLAAESLIVNELKAKRPSDAILAEEETGEDLAPSADLLDAQAGRVWCIDPLDGTTNFSHSFPHFCVSIALIEAGESVVGVIYDPMRRWTFWATRGGGAWRDGVQLNASGQTEMKKALLATGYPYDRHTSEHDNLAQTRALLKRCQGLRRAGAAALDLAFVSAGWLDGYWEYKLKPWDIAAGVLLIQEAGGVVTDHLGGSDWFQLGSLITAGVRPLHEHISICLSEVS